ncbi:MAG TPA: MFS transporter [Candidatus Angelobacter sp.]|nr:MFS transporter [Candidatus Angelobacter sp.]
MVAATSEPPTPSRLFTRAFITLGIAELAYFVAQGLLIAITPRFAAGPLGADEAGVGFAIGAFAVTALLLRPYAGRAADRRGRRLLLVGGALLSAIAIAAHAVAPSLAVLIGLRLLLGVAEAFFFVAAIAMVADLAPPGRAGEAMSYNSLALYLGIAFGPGVGEMLLDAGGYPVAWLGGAALAGAATVMALSLRETGERAADDEPLVLIHRGALLPSIGLFTGVAAMSGFLGFVPLYTAETLGIGGAGTVLLVFGMVVVVTRVVFARLPDRVPGFVLAAAALLGVTFGLGLMWLFPTVVGLYAGAILTALGVAFMTPAFFTAIVARVRPAERGVALGTTSLFIDLGFGGGPVITGLVAGAAGYAAGFGAVGLVALAGAIGTAYAAVARPSSAERG